MNDAIPAAVLILGLLVAVWLVRKTDQLGRALQSAPPPGAAPGTLRLGQFAVQPGAGWLVLQPGQM